MNACIHDSGSLRPLWPEWPEWRPCPLIIITFRPLGLGCLECSSARVLGEAKGVSIAANKQLTTECSTSLCLKVPHSPFRVFCSLFSPLSIFLPSSSCPLFCTSLLLSFLLPHHSGPPSASFRKGKAKEWSRCPCRALTSLSVCLLWAPFHLRKITPHLLRPQGIGLQQKPLHQDDLRVVIS